MKLDKPILKFKGKGKMWKNHQENFRKRKKREDLRYYIAKLYYQATVLTIVWWQHKNKQT